MNIGKKLAQITQPLKAKLGRRDFLAQTGAIVAPTLKQNPVQTISNNIGGKLKETFRQAKSVTTNLNQLEKNGAKNMSRRSFLTGAGKKIRKEAVVRPVGTLKTGTKVLGSVNPMNLDPIDIAQKQYGKKLGFTGFLKNFSNEKTITRF